MVSLELPQPLLQVLPVLIEIVRQCDLGRRLAPHDGDVLSASLDDLVEIRPEGADEDPEVGLYNKRTGSTYIGLSDGKTNTSQQILIGGISADARTRITNSALDLLRRYLQMRSS